MRHFLLMLAPGLGLCALVLVASVVGSAPEGLVIGLAAALLLACGAGVVLSHAADERDHDVPYKR